MDFRRQCSHVFNILKEKLFLTSNFTYKSLEYILLGILLVRTLTLAKIRQNTNMYALYLHMHTLKYNRILFLVLQQATVGISATEHDSCLCGHSGTAG